MFLDSVETHFSTFTLSGFPSFAATERLEAEILAEAAIELSEPPSRGRQSPTTFHVAISGGEPLGVATTTVGPLADLPLGLALRAAGVDLGAEIDLPDTTCELVSLSIDPDAERNTTGVTEALYRSFYRHAKQSGARSVVVGVDPWVFDVLTEQYGVPFTVLGPPLDLLGRELLAIGGEIEVLEQGILQHAPEFFTYLSAPANGPVPIGFVPV
jgi:hypothetical protein